MPDANRPLSVVLIRHAESVAPGISGFDEYTRPLTTKGFRDAHQLCDALSSTTIDAVYSSPYLRARQTIEPIPQARDLTIETVDDLRERLLSPSDLPNSRAHLNPSPEHFHHA